MPKSKPCPHGDVDLYCDQCKALKGTSAVAKAPTLTSPASAAPVQAKTPAPTSPQANLLDPVDLLASLTQRRLTPEMRREWSQQALALQAYPAADVIGAMKWACLESPYWSEWGFTMEKFVWKAEDILVEYRAALRKKEILDRQANGLAFSPSCLALVARWPGKTRPQIEDLETKLRVDAQATVFKKACKICKGKQTVPSKEKRIRGVQVLCASCESYRRSIWNGIQKTVLDELYA